MGMSLSKKVDMVYRLKWKRRKEIFTVTYDVT